MNLKPHYRLMEKADDETKGGAGGDDVAEAAKLAAERGDDFGDDDDDEAGDAAKKAEAGKAVAEEAAALKAAAAEKKDAEKKDVRIPKDRFDEAVNKERDARMAAEAKAKELEEALDRQNKGVDLKTLEAEIDDLEDRLEAEMAEGTPAARKDLRRQIRDRQEQISDAKANARAVHATALAVEQIRYDAVVDKMEVDFPFLNVDNKEVFDSKVASAVIELKGAYEAAGLASSEALKKAMSTLRRDLEDAKKALRKDDEGEELTAEEKVAKAEKEAKEKTAGRTAEAAAERRREEAVKKGLEARTKQPADSKAVGKGDKTIVEPDVKKMTDKQFDDLPEAELQRMRGDQG